MSREYSSQIAQQTERVRGRGERGGVGERATESESKCGGGVGSVG